MDALLIAVVGLGLLWIGVQIGLLSQTLHSFQVMLNHYLQDLLRRLDK